MRFKHGVTHVIFFDIEYYVPEEHRNRPGLKANPYLNGGFVIGGVFQRYFPIENKFEKKEEFWIWEMNGKDIQEKERELLRKIYYYFRESWTRLEVFGNGPRLTEPIAAGFGIARFDIPVLFVRSLIHEIAEPEKLYETYFKMRHLDLSVASVPLTPERKYPEVLAPVSQNWVIKNLLMIENKKPSGTEVWDFYDRSEHDRIRKRTIEEIEISKDVYFKLKKIRNKRNRE
ncbi:3'-5' exonuclease family protein [Thermococcus thermotolerans]|uniref:hypothetical protein n=1 Tax=Thermococcus thermotolerans TaxID=2969672 RepID=UPI002157F26D|nr:hypothetical protein [Thermococcus thermotolerans]